MDRPTQVKVIYTFEAQPNTGEISVNEGEILTVTRSDVGEGWWEGTNSFGRTGLFPAAYVEEYISGPPAMPPPPLPTSYAPSNTYGNDDWAKDLSSAFQNFSSSQKSQSVQNVIQNTQNQSLRTSSVPEDDWDEDWDDDDSDVASHTNGTTGYGFPNNKQVNRLASATDTSSEKEGYRSSTKLNFNRFSIIAKSSLEDYLAGLGRFPIDDRDKVYVDDDGHAPFWRRSGVDFSCSITDPRKGSKFHGMKSFIAYTITPSTTNQPVSRRYKHFDWLHDRLTIKFSMIPIPPLPAKTIAGRFEDELIEYRMTMLQSFMDRLCQHPVLSQCQVFRLFITCPNDEKTWKAGKRKAESDKLVGANFYQAIVRPDTPLDLIKTENKVDGYQRFFSHLDEATKLLQKTCSEQTHKCQGAFKTEFNKISLSFSKLSRAFDMDPNNLAPHLTDGIRRVSEAYQEIGTIYEMEPKHDWEPLNNLLYEYKGMIDSFPNIISAAKGSIQKRKQLEKDASEGKADQDQLPPVVHRSDTIVYTLHAEVTNFHHTRQRDFKAAMTCFLTEQVNFYQKIADQLRDTLKHFSDC